MQMCILVLHIIKVTGAAFKLQDLLMAKSDQMPMSDFLSLLFIYFVK